MKLLFLMFAISMLNIQIFSQNFSKDFKLVKGKPSVYISYYQKDNIISGKTREKREIYWLRIHNNTKNSISFCQYDSSVSPTGKIGAHYEIEKSLDRNDLSTRNNSTIPIGFPTFDFCNEYTLKSGNSFVFGVPASHLIKGTRLKIRFYFSWENIFESRAGSEPEHYAHFYEVDLPR